MTQPFRVLTLGKIEDNSFEENENDIRVGILVTERFVKDKTILLFVKLHGVD